MCGGYWQEYGADMYAMALVWDILPVTAAAMDMAGLICAPDIGRNMVLMVIIPSPVTTPV